MPYNYKNEAQSWAAMRPHISHQRYQTPYAALCNGVISHGAQFGNLWQKANAKQMCSRSLRAVWLLTWDCLHAQTTVRAGNSLTWQTTIILITVKTRRPPNWAPCGDQDGVGSGISGVYLWMRQQVFSGTKFAPITQILHINYVHCFTTSLKQNVMWSSKISRNSEISILK